MILVSLFNVFFLLLQLLRYYISFIKCSLRSPFTTENTRHPCQKIACLSCIYLAKWAHIKLSFTFLIPKYLLWLDKRWWKLHPRTSNPARHISICPTEDCQKHFFLRFFFFFIISQSKILSGRSYLRTKICGGSYPDWPLGLWKTYLTKIEGRKTTDAQKWYLQNLFTSFL